MGSSKSEILNNVSASTFPNVYLLASATGVNGATLASTALTFTTSVTLALYVPIYVVFKFASGTLGIGVAKIKNTSGDISALTALVGVVLGTQISAVLQGLMVATGNISVEVTTASAGASTFSVYVYGISRP